METEIMATIKEHVFLIVNNHKDEIHEKFHIEHLSVFGSVAKGIAGPSSDVDILVRYRKTPGLFDFLNFKKYLEDIVGRPVDLVTEGALKKQLAKQIIKEAIRVI